MAKKWACTFFYVLSALLFGWLSFAVLFQNIHFAYHWYVVLPLAVAWLSVFYGLLRLCQKHGKWLIHNHKKILLFFFLLLTGTQVLFYLLCASYPTQDFERVFTGAYNYAITGEILDPYLDYFYKFPNNLPLTVLLQFVFRVGHRFGVENFFAVGAVLNAVCIQLAYLFVYLITEKLAGKTMGFFALFTLYLCLPLQSYISIFYTDTTTMLFPLAIVYFFIMATQAKNRKKQGLYIGLLSLFAAFGTAIKYSVVIALIAVLLVLIINKAFKKAAACLLGFVVSFLLINMGVQAFVYQNILDETLAQDKATPYLAWIAMGMQGDGSHSAEENHYIWSFETKEEKEQAALELVQIRLGQKTLPEHLTFLGQKAVRSFGSGGFDYQSTVSGAPMTQNFMIDVLNPSGAYNAVYDNVIQGYHVAVLLLMFVGFVLSLYYKEERFLPLQIASLGMFLFLLLWEAGTRYLLNYYPVFLLCGVVVVATLLVEKKKILFKS